MSSRGARHPAIIYPTGGEARASAPTSDHARPATHALIIGIGCYRHLVDGTDTRDALPQQVGTLKQLTGAPRSALAFTELAIAAAGSWRAPLGSVELLLTV